MAEQRDEGGPDDVRYAMDETRARLAETADELGEALRERAGDARERVSAVRERVQVGELVRQHPWPALGLALGVGLAFAASGADRAVAGAASSAAGATTERARRAARSAKESVHRRRARAQLQSEAVPEGGHRASLIERLTSGILAAIDVDGFVAQLRSAGAAGTRSRAADAVSRNRLAQHDYWREEPSGD